MSKKSYANWLRKQREFVDTLYLQKTGWLTKSLGVAKIIPAELKLVNPCPTFEDLAELIAAYRLTGIHSYDTTLEQARNTSKLVIYKKNINNNWVYNSVQTYNTNLGEDVYKDVNSLLEYMHAQNGIAIYEVTKRDFSNPRFTQIRDKINDANKIKADFLNKSDFILNISKGRVGVSEEALRVLVEQELKKYNYDFDLNDGTFIYIER